MKHPRKRHSIVLALSLMTTLCLLSPVAHAEEADFILYAEKIWTGDPRQPYVSSLAARNGKIIALGTRDIVSKLKTSTTRILDLPQSFATPGLIDAHAHLSSLGGTFELVELRDVDSIDEVVSRVVARAIELPENEWVVGRSWDQSLWPGKELPSHVPLTTAVPDRGVFLRRVGGHSVWVNQFALDKAGITAATKDPPGGQILRDKRGNPTGVLLDAAVPLVSKHMRSSGLSLKHRFLKAQTACLKVGLTGVHDAGLSPSEITTISNLEHDEELKIRVYGMAHPPKGNEIQFVSRPPTMVDPKARFQVRAIKLFVDGAMGSRGAAMFEPYSDDPGNTGLILTDFEKLKAITERSLKHGWQVCTHAIGDRGNWLVLEAYEQALSVVPRKDHRLRIEHAQVVRQDDFARFERLGVIASMQPTHATTDKRWAADRLGSQRVAGAYAWRTFLEHNVTLAFGSDFPVERVDPVLGIHASVTRQDAKGLPIGGWTPEQRLSLDETLEAFTHGAAYAGFAENEVGTLKIGMQCDVSVFATDMTTAAPNKILGTRCIATVIGGEVVFQM